MCDESKSWDDLNRRMEDNEDKVTLSSYEVSNEVTVTKGTNISKMSDRNTQHTHVHCSTPL